MRSFQYPRFSIRGSENETVSKAQETEQIRGSEFETDPRLRKRNNRPEKILRRLVSNENQGYKRDVRKKTMFVNEGVQCHERMETNNDPHEKRVRIRRFGGSERQGIVSEG